jgi:hypothetical protein
MTTEDKMTTDEQRKYLRRMKKRYVKAGRVEKGQLLDEMEAVTDMHRKSLIRLINGSLDRKPRCRQRGVSYGPEVDDALRVIHESFDHICADRLTPNLVWMAKHLAAHGELETTPFLLEQLAQVSISTVKRRLQRMTQDQPRLPRRRSRKRASKQLAAVPMVRIPWNEQEPGHLEVDLVHHCGSTASGDYVCSFQMIDAATGWSERTAVLGRSYLVMEDAFMCVLLRLPFPVVEFHPDNDSVFFNNHVFRFWEETVPGVQLSRSRPYHKNDNRFVEQKNFTLIRAYAGYQHLDTVAHVLAVNQLYDKMWIYYKPFQPVMHLVEKEIVREEGQITRVRRRHDKARTPFDGLCDTKAILPPHKEQLEALRDSINPRRLRSEIYDDIHAIFKLPCAQPDSNQNVHLTLAKNRDNRKEPLSNLAFSRTRVKPQT